VIQALAESLETNIGLNLLIDFESQKSFAVPRIKFGSPAPISLVAILFVNSSFPGFAVIVKHAYYRVDRDHADLDAVVEQHAQHLK